MAAPFLSRRPAVLAIAIVALFACRDSVAPPSPASVAPNVATATDGTAGLPLSTSPTFVVRDGNGNVLGGVAVAIAVTAGGGTIPDAPTKSEAGPTPIGTWTLGRTAGLNTVTITVAGLPAATINVNGKAGPASEIVFVAGGNQSGVAGGALTVPPVAQVRDQFGNGVSGAEVIFTVADGGGIVSNMPITTDASGNAASSTWRLGKSAVPQSLRATSANLTVVLTAGILSDYDIDLRFYGPPMPPAAAAAFVAAAARIKASVIGDVQNVTFINPLDVGATCGVTGVVLPAGSVIDDVIIYATVAPIDGPGKILGFAGPCTIRPGSALTSIGTMQFDSDDIDRMISTGTIQDVIQHEMLHVVGIGTLWATKGLLAGAHTVDSRFTGTFGINACIGLGGSSICPASVPVENSGGGGTADAHWRETTFGTELMTGFIQPVNQFSTMSIQSMADLGYTVNPLAADAYVIPGTSVQQSRANILSDLSPAWERVMAPKWTMSKTGRLSPAEKQ
jgi:hypothetical protein